MAKFYLTRKAIEDLNNIWSYTYNKWSEEKADNYYNMLLDCCNTLSTQQHLGKAYNNIQAQLKGYKAQKHLIFYRIIKHDLIEITRILHGRMDIKNQISK